MGKSQIPHFSLNVIRVLNILSILACIVASGSLLVKTSNLTSDIGWYNVFDLAEKALIIMFGMWLLVTEIPAGRAIESYIARRWPLFSYDSGFTPLAICLLFLGCDVLSYLAKTDTDEKTLGGDFFRMVQAAGFMALVMSIINFIASFVFQDRRRGMTARQVRAYRQDQAEAI